MESTSAWYWLYDALVEAGYEVVVSNPKKTKAIASAKIKNDKLDANMLAQLLRADLLATVYVSPLEFRELKEFLRHRARLVRDATRVKNRIRNLLNKNNLKPPVKRLFGKKGRAWLEAVELPSYQQRSLDNYLYEYDHLRVLLDPLDEEVRQRAKANDQAQLLMSIPGIGPLVSLMFLAEVGDISRFPSHRHLASYIGIVPGLDSSAGNDKQRSITKQGSPWLRSALVEAAQAVSAMKGSRLNIFYRKKITKAGYRRAVVSTAHRIMMFAFFVLRDQRPYQEQLKKAA
jgi:transposase